MIRNTFLAVLGVLTLAASSHAAVTLNSVKGTSALPGYSLFTLTAVSDDPLQPFLGFDFAGDPDNNDPATGLGFFGAMSQVNPIAPTFSTVFMDNNALFNAAVPARNVNEDSQFLFAPATDTSVVNSTPAAQEGANILQASFVFVDPKGLSIPVVQLAIPDAQAGAVNYRGTALVGASGAGVNVPLAGCVGDSCGGGLIPPLVADIGPATAGEDAVADILGEVLNLEPVDTAPGSPVVAWALVGVPTYTPGFGALPAAPGLGSATFSINAATGAFQFNTLGSTRGTYVFNGTATGPGGSDNFSLTTEVRVVPEPATLSLFGLALVGFVGFARKRS